MMTTEQKFHINTQTGNPGPCNATKKPCPHGGEENHFASEDEARAAYEVRMRESYDYENALANLDSLADDLEGSVPDPGEYRFAATQLAEFGMEHDQEKTVHLAQEWAAGDDPYESLVATSFLADARIKQVRPVPAMELTDANQNPYVLAAVAEAKETGKFVPLDELDSIGYTDGVNESSCGDYSLGAEPSNRMTWATGRDEEPFVTVTATYFVTARKDNEYHDLTQEDLEEALAARAAWQKIIDHGYTEGNEPEFVEPVRYSWEEQTEWIAHTDVADPGGTEVRSEMERGEGSATYFHSLEAAGNVAQRNAIQEDWTTYHPQNWR